ncbi:MAG: hypothetical protein A2Y62_10020 [Candidatus Fischerbacteria bacterium RBG_13_37_8]|uniref:Molybdenum hydroxylase n=1 Tax=Candidatus Fischerbacteria bacterium RBG_13_37_8 TaxID=1817863 RepID=A0A1F5V5V6_9BACT|nr:MAG: hypothetical protein A2Y62_10020 [Candidatus Fischerbacteria bacterium RBG_13_37_8]
MKNSNLQGLKICLRSGGDLASGIAYRLCRAGANIVITELPQPKLIRRTVSYGNAIFEGTFEVEGIKAKRVEDRSEIEACWNEKILPVRIDPEETTADEIDASIIIDARMKRRNIGNDLNQKRLIIGIGPGFIVGINCTRAVETVRGHFLGRVIYEGKTQDSHGVPGEINGYSYERLIRSPADGLFLTTKSIGDLIEKDETIATVNGIQVNCEIKGMIRGLLHPDLYVIKGQKIADIDPRCKREYAFTISDKALAVGGGVLEAILN